MGMKLFNDTSAYMKDVTNLIWNYIRHRDLYPENAQLAVQPEIMANVIDDPSSKTDPRLIVQCLLQDLLDGDPDIVSVRMNDRPVFFPVMAGRRVDVLQPYQTASHCGFFSFLNGCAG